jgi:hypothetical protein
MDAATYAGLKPLAEPTTPHRGRERGVTCGVDGGSYGVTVRRGVRLLGSRDIEVGEGFGCTTGGGEVAKAGAAFARFAGQLNVLLTTYRNDGRPPVHIAVDGEGERAFVRTWDTAWKLKRMRRNLSVTVAPSTFRGKPTGPALSARARIKGRRRRSPPAPSPASARCCMEC